MSEIKDELFYNVYDFLKSIYIYSHMKTSLVDKARQDIEYFTNNSFLIIVIIFVFGFVFKLLVVFIYLFLIGGVSAIFSFFKSLIKSKGKISFLSSIRNGSSFFGQISKRIVFYNFYCYDKWWIMPVMIIPYILFMGITFSFCYYNREEIENTEKTDTYLILFYIQFESMILVHLLCTSFYAHKNMSQAILLGLGIFICNNLMLILGYLIKERIEFVDGIYEYDEPQKIFNILFNIIFLMINVISFINTLVAKVTSK